MCEWPPKEKCIAILFFSPSVNGSSATDCTEGHMDYRAFDISGVNDPPMKRIAIFFSSQSVNGSNVTD